MQSNEPKAPEPHAHGGACFLRLPDGRRTRCYMTLEACHRAVERGDVYTNAEYAALTAMPRKKPR